MYLTFLSKNKSFRIRKPIKKYSFSGVLSPHGHRPFLKLNENIAKKQDASTAITTGNIGQQSVNYAATAGSATTASTANVVAWGKRLK